MASLRVLLMLLFLSLCATSRAQSPTLPSCAAKCLLNAFGSKTCAPIDQACICTNPAFQNNVTLCVRKSCTVIETLAARNISLATCGAPVRNRGQDYAALSNVMISISGAFVAIRLVFKATVSPLHLGCDDWIVLATFTSAVPSAIITVHGTVKNGLGQDIWALRPQQVTEMLRHFYIMAILYFTELALLKLCLIFFYIPVFPGKGVQRILWGTVVFVTLWGVAYVLTAIFQCRPISYFWTKWDGLHKGSCLDINAVASTNAGISIALDLWILAIPLWQLWGLNMHWKKKVGVALMFCVGTFVTVVSILRLMALVHFAASENASWEFYDVSVWSTVEISVGIMCACMPTLRLLLVKLFPILGSSSARSGQHYYNYGSGNELQNVSQGKRPMKTNGAVTSHRSGDMRDGEGVMIQHSFSVEYGNKDLDEASLVSHRGKLLPNLPLT